MRSRTQVSLSLYIRQPYMYCSIYDIGLPYKIDFHAIVEEAGKVAHFENTTMHIIHFNIQFKVTLIEYQLKRRSLGKFFAKFDEE